MIKRENNEGRINQARDENNKPKYFTIPEMMIQPSCKKYKYILEEISQSYPGVYASDREYGFIKEICYDNKVVGLSFYNETHIEDTKYWVIEFIYVLPEYRGNNLLYKEIQDNKSLGAKTAINHPNHYIINSLIKNNLTTQLNKNLIKSEILFSLSPKKGLQTFSEVYDTYLSSIIYFNENNQLVLSAMHDNDILMGALERRGSVKDIREYSNNVFNILRDNHCRISLYPSGNLPDKIENVTNFKTTWFGNNIIINNEEPSLKIVYGFCSVNTETISDIKYVRISNPEKVPSGIYGGGAIFNDECSYKNYCCNKYCEYNVNPNFLDDQIKRLINMVWDDELEKGNVDEFFNNFKNQLLDDINFIKSKDVDLMNGKYVSNFMKREVIAKEE